MVPVVINIFFLKINVIENTSSLNIGQNYMADFNSFNKTNAGTGPLYGDQSIMDLDSAFVSDPDLVDMPSVKQTFPNTASKLLKWNNIIK